MHLQQIHKWDLDYKQAVSLQIELAKQVCLQPLDSSGLRLIAGVDVSSQRDSKYLWASIVVLSYPDCDLIEVKSARRTDSFPYIPGLLSFRELPVVLDACRQLENVPDVVICDGQGIAHPRHFGLACHLGFWLNLPTIGCAKSKLVGEADEPGIDRASRCSLRLENKVVGSVLRTRTAVKPVFVSPGHLMDNESAVDVILRCGKGRRLPEPTRLAHIEVNHRRRLDQKD